jgi:hypothetical protein
MRLAGVGWDWAFCDVLRRSVEFAAYVLVAARSALSGMALL